MPRKRRQGRVSPIFLPTLGAGQLFTPCPTGGGPVFAGADAKTDAENGLKIARRRRLVNNPQGGMGRSALGDLKFVGRPLGLRLRQGQDKRVALLVFLHFYPAFEMLSQFRDAFQIGFLDDDFYGVFGAPELAPDHARLEPQHEIRIAAGKSGNDAEYGAVFTDIGHDGFLSENVSVGEGAVIGLGIPEFFERRHVDEIVLRRIESPDAAMADVGLGGVKAHVRTKKS
jgi:hypothetical protein